MDMSSNIIIDKKIDIHSSNFIKKRIGRYIYLIFNFVNNLIIRYNIYLLKKFKKSCNEFSIEKIIYF